MTLQQLANEHTIQGERQVLVTEVTRMKNGVVCVAGIDIHSGNMVRPLMGDGSNWDEQEWVESGFLRVGSVLSFRPALQGHPAYPHATEDYRVKHVTLLTTAPGATVYAACAGTAESDIETLFAGNLIDHKYVVDGTVCRSLGCVLIPKDRLKVGVFYGKVQVSVRAGHNSWYNPPVTELATKAYEDPEAGAGALRGRIDGYLGFQPIALRLGLPRAWDGPEHDYDPKRCYLQLNGVVIPA